MGTLLTLLAGIGTLVLGGLLLQPQLPQLKPVRVRDNEPAPARDQGSE